MLPDGPTDHFTLNSEGIDVAPDFSRPEVVLAARYAELHKLVSFLDANLANATVTIDSAPCGLFEIVAILDDLYLAPDIAGRLDVKLDLGADGPALVARGQQVDVGLVVSILDRG